MAGQLYVGEVQTRGIGIHTGRANGESPFQPVAQKDTVRAGRRDPKLLLDSEARAVESLYVEAYA